MLKYFTLLAIALPAVLSAQLSINTNDNTNADLLARTIVNNPSIKIESAFYTGCPISRGTFTATNSNLGLTSGIILASGDANKAIGPNSSEGMASGSCNSGTLGDPDLNAILANYPNMQTTMDASILEFDLNSETATTLTFTYVFGSEEYPSFLNFTYTDMVGMFVSAPNIPKYNIALIPGTTDPVGVDWVNHLTNTQYYVDNGDGATPQGTIQYNGFTTPLTATIVMEPNVIYHLKIVVADAGDYGWDAGVFIGGTIPQATAVNEIATTYIKLYPNPAKEFAMLNYNLGTTNKATVNIIDALGRNVYTESINSTTGNLQIPLNSLAAGLYSIRVTDAEMKIWNSKLVVVE